MRFDDVSTAIKPLKPEPIYVHADLGGADTRIEQSRPTMAWRYCEHAGTGPNILEVGVRTAPTRCTKGLGVIRLGDCACLRLITRGPIRVRGRRNIAPDPAARWTRSV